MTDAFSAAKEAIDGHDPNALRAVLARAPEVVHEVGGGNANTLLGMATATCDDRTVALLLAAGADVDGANVHGWTPLHQVAYMGALHLLDPLLSAGARTDGSARGDGGTPLVVALFWGRREMADALVAAGGVQPRNLRAAAGAGDAALVDELLGTAEAGTCRAYYRPHTGFPEWTPADDPQEVLDEALAYAARNDRVALLGPLVDAGARLEADVYRGTALIWAASNGCAAAVGRLLELGADPMGRGEYGGESHGHAVTPLHLAGASGDEATARVLLAAGADPAVLDGHGYGTPAGWARHDGHEALGALIESWGCRDEPHGSSEVGPPSR